MKQTILQNTIEKKILLVRAHKVMLDYDLARLYQIETKLLKRAVKRNRSGFRRILCLNLLVKNLKT